MVRVAILLLKNNNLVIQHKLMLCFSVPLNQNLAEVSIETERADRLPFLLEMEPPRILEFLAQMLMVPFVVVCSIHRSTDHHGT